jgi:glycine betaine transporter
MYEKIMVPLDGSRFSNRALQYAVDLAPRYDAALLLVEVIEPATIIPAVDPTGMSSTVTTKYTIETAVEQDKMNLSRAKRYLAGKVRDLKNKGISAEYRALQGEPADEIIKLGRKEKVDLIVMATHGRSGFRRAIMGSVADTVIRKSGDPVLVVRPRQQRRRKK